MKRHKKLYADFFLRKRLTLITFNRMFWKALRFFGSQGYLSTRYVGNRLNTLKVYRSVHNCCYMSGRTRSVVSQFRLSRNLVKLYGNMGILYGLKKASW